MYTWNRVLLNQNLALLFTPDEATTLQFNGSHLLIQSILEDEFMLAHLIGAFHEADIAGGFALAFDFADLELNLVDEGWVLGLILDGNRPSLLVPFFHLFKGHDCLVMFLDYYGTILVFGTVLLIQCPLLLQLSNRFFTIALNRWGGAKGFNVLVEILSLLIYPFKYSFHH